MTLFFGSLDGTLKIGGKTEEIVIGGTQTTGDISIGNKTGAGKINANKPLTIGYDITSRVTGSDTHLNGLLLSTYSNTNSSLFATERAYCPFTTAVSLGRYMVIMTLRTYGTNGTNPFVVGKVRRTATAPTNGDLSPSSHKNIDVGGEIYETVYSTTNETGITLQSIGWMEITSDAQYPYIAFSNTNSTANVFFSLTLMRIG